MSQSRPYKPDYVVYPSPELYYALATTNPASGCKNCNPGDILCELGKVGCEAGAALTGSSNAVQTNLKNAAGRDVAAINQGGKNLSNAWNKDMTHISKGLDEDFKNDPVLGTLNALQDVGAGVGDFFEGGGGSQMLLPIAAIGGVILLVVLLKR